MSAAMAERIHPNKEEAAPKKRRTRNEGAAIVKGGVHVRTQIVSPDLCGTSSPGTPIFAERD